jgi:LPS O-antigen subunit length determinant protein (WzzB/FepE family)
MLMLAGLFAALGCERKPADRPPGKVTSEDVRRDAGQAVKTAEVYSQQTKEEFQKHLDARLNELDAKIAKLREKGRGLKDEAKANWEQKMAKLETKRKAASVKLAAVRHSTAEAWKDVQKGAQSAYDDLDKAFRDAAREF